MADVSLTVTRRLPSFILLALSVAVLALVIALSVGIANSPFRCKPPLRR
ncbi:Uncharacterised protein [Cronobacter sakazakii]|nr:Uncharacterised protein [Cronobacter sakazakii]